MMALSLRTRLLLIFLGLTLVSILLVSLLAVDAFTRLGSTAQSRTSNELTAQVEGDLEQFNTAAARENDRFFAQISSQAQVIAGFIADQYALQMGTGAQSGGDLLNSGADFKLFVLPDGQQANGPNEVSTIFVPNFQELNARVVQDIKISASLEQLLPGVARQLPSVIALYFGTPNEVLRYYPNLINVEEALPADFRVTSRPWYIQAIASGLNDESGQAANTTGVTTWAEPYADATGKGIVTTAAAAVYGSDRERPGELLGVVGLDITLSEILSAVESNNLVEEGYSILVDSQGRGLVMPAQAYQDLLHRERREDDFAPDLTQSDQAFQQIVNRMKAGESGLERLELGGKQLLIAFSPLATTGWSLGSIVKPSLVLAPVDRLESELATDARNLLVTRMLPATLVLTFIVVLLGLILTNRWLNPIQHLAAAAQKIAEGQYEVDLPKATKDEIGVLSGAFRMMKEAIQSTLNSLEQRVADRTTQLERRTAQLAAAADVARDITQYRDLDTLLDRTVSQIQDRFGFYHAGIFLLDSNREYAVMRAANSPGGLELLKQGHRLRVGRTSIVGYVVETAQPRIVLDTNADAIHFKNPLLPETQSEAALPLIITSSDSAGASRVIGVLDVQSKEVNAFERDDIAALQILADQLAVALDNAGMFSEFQKSLDELERLYGQFSQDAWSRLIQERQLVGYELSQAGTVPLYSDAPENDSMLVINDQGALRTTALQTTSVEITPGEGAAIKQYSLPVRIRGETVATLEIWPGKENFSENEMLLLGELTDRLSQALESARLYEEAQKRAAREEVINQFSSALGDTIDLNALLQSAVRQIGNMPNVSEVSIRINPSE